MKPNIAIGELVFVCLCTVTVDNGVLIEIDSLDVAHRKVIDINHRTVISLLIYRRGSPRPKPDVYAT